MDAQPDEVEQQQQNAQLVEQHTPMELEGQATSAEPEPESQTLAPAPVPVMRNESWLEERPGDTVESQPDDQQEMTHARAVQVMQNAARKALSRRTANNLRGLQSLGVALSMSEREAKRVSRWDEM